HKPATQCGSDDPTTCQQFKVIVVRLLWRRDSRRIVILRNADPVSAHSNARDWMRREHLKRRFPDFFSGSTQVRCCDGFIKLITYGFNSASQTIAAHPDRPKKHSSNKND